MYNPTFFIRGFGGFCIHNKVKNVDNSLWVLIFIPVGQRGKAGENAGKAEKMQKIDMPGKEAF